MHWALFPGLAIFLTVLTINFVGDGLRDAFDPRRVLYGGPGRWRSLDIQGLKTHFKTDDGWLHAVDGVDLSIDAGQTVCVVGDRVAAKRHRQDGDAPDRHAAGQDRGRARAWKGGPGAGERRGDAEDPRQGDRDHLPGADDQPQPGVHRRRADRREREAARAVKAAR